MVERETVISGGSIASLARHCFRWVEVAAHARVRQSSPPFGKPSLSARSSPDDEAHGASRMSRSIAGRAAHIHAQGFYPRTNAAAEQVPQRLARAATIRSAATLAGYPL